MLLTRLNRFDAYNSSDWYNYSRSSYFLDVCSHSDVIALFVELFSVGSIPGSPEHEAVRLCVTPQAVRATLAEIIEARYICGYSSLACACRRAYCERFDDYPCDWWHDQMHKSDARQRVIMLCNSLTYPFVQSISPNGTYPDFYQPDVSVAIE